MKFLIITPACNEEKNLPDLIQSMKNQSLLPSKWIIVDDGSIDNTSHVIQTAALTYSWLSYLRKNKTDMRAPGKSVIETFYFGLDSDIYTEYDLIMKLDADLILPSNYLEMIAQKFIANPNLGICGGVCVLKNDGQYILEKETNLDHVRGAIKTYHRDCFISIGGLLRQMGWDTVDEHSARFKGWGVLVLPDLQVIHQRVTHKEYGFIKAAFRNGKMLYSIRMDFILLIGNCIKKCVKRPYLLLAIVMFLGYLKAFLNRDQLIVSRELGSFIRKYRYKKLLERVF